MRDGKSMRTGCSIPQAGKRKVQVVTFITIEKSILLSASTRNSIGQEHTFRNIVLSWQDTRLHSYMNHGGLNRTHKLNTEQSWVYATLDRSWITKNATRKTRGGSDFVINTKMNLKNYFANSRNTRLPVRRASKQN